MTPTNLREQLQRDEGCRLKLYMDSLGHPTIGYGRALDMKGISLAEAELMLDNDILTFKSGVLAEWPWTARLDEARQGVLHNMAFNLGIAGLGKFVKMLTAVKTGHFEIAAEEMLDSLWHQQVGVRAERLAQQMRSGEWQ